MPEEEKKRRREDFARHSQSPSHLSAAASPPSVSPAIISTVSTPVPARACLRSCASAALSSFQSPLRMVSSTFSLLFRSRAASSETGRHPPKSVIWRICDVLSELVTHAGPQKGQEIENIYLDVAQLGDQNVLGLQITITKPALVQKVHSGHNFTHNKPGIGRESRLMQIN